MHTPGPWTATADTDARNRPGYRIDSETLSLMAWIAIGDGSEPEISDNARLIAAAPELLEALQLALPRMTDPIDINQARAAIAKATGKGI